MPLKSGKSAKTISANIKKEVKMDTHILSSISVRCADTEPAMLAVLLPSGLMLKARKKINGTRVSAVLGWGCFDGQSDNTIDNIICDAITSVRLRIEGMRE